MWILKFGIDRGLDNIKQQAIEDQANSLNAQGAESRKKSDYNGALKKYKLALEMFKRLFPGDNEDVAISYNNLVKVN